MHLNDDDIVVNDLLQQLKTTTNINKKASKEKFSLSNEDLKQFLLDNTGKLIKKTIDVVDEIRDNVIAAPNAEDIEAFSKLISASASAVESLNKILIADERNKTSKEIKQMDIEARKTDKENEDSTPKIMFNREELLDMIVQKAIQVEAEEIPDKSR